MRDSGSIGSQFTSPVGLVLEATISKLPPGPSFMSFASR
jgi:hypothetical protein